MVSGSIGDGWETFKRYPWLILGALVLVVLVNGALSAPGMFLQEDGAPTAASTWWSMLSGLATFPLSAGAGYLLLRLVRGESDAGVETLLHGYSRYLALLGTVVLTSIIVGVGFLLLIVPGIIASFGLMHAPMLVLDKGLGAADAIRASWEMMKGYKLDAFLLALSYMMIAIAGALALGVGLLVAIPVIAAASAAFYNRVLAANPPPQIAGLAGADAVDVVG